VTHTSIDWVRDTILVTLKPSFRRKLKSFVELKRLSSQTIYSDLIGYFTSSSNRHSCGTFVQICQYYTPFGIAPVPIKAASGPNISHWPRSYLGSLSKDRWSLIVFCIIASWLGPAIPNTSQRITLKKETNRQAAFTAHFHRRFEDSLSSYISFWFSRRAQHCKRRLLLLGASLFVLDR
jgi:hypothetical protein